MYSPAARPSSTRAAPAKKRMLSAATGISSFAYDSGFPTFFDSSAASSSAFSSIRSASLKRSSARSPGVVSSHSGRAVFAAWTARSASSAVLLATSAITSPVEGRSEEHTSELQSHHDLVCRLLLEKKKKKTKRDLHNNKKKKKQTVC